MQVAALRSWQGPCKSPEAEETERQSRSRARAARRLGPPVAAPSEAVLSGEPNKPAAEVHNRKQAEAAERSATVEEEFDTSLEVAVEQAEPEPVSASKDKPGCNSVEFLAEPDAQNDWRQRPVRHVSQGRLSPTIPKRFAQILPEPTPKLDELERLAAILMHSRDRPTPHRLFRKIRSGPSMHPR